MYRNQGFLSTQIVESKLSENNNHMKKAILSLSICLLTSLIAFGQNDKEGVEAALMDYMEGTSKGDLSRIKRAFTETAALYTVNNDGSLKRIPIAQYIGYFKEGQTNDRKGKIVSIDIVNNAANAKVEIVSRGWKFTDYMLLLKIKGSWKIINKSYTRERVN